MIPTISGAPFRNQAASAMAMICTRISVPIHIETGSTFVRCSTCEAPTIGESTPPRFCSDWPTPTSRFEPVIRCR